MNGFEIFRSFNGLTVFWHGQFWVFQLICTTIYCEKAPTYQQTKYTTFKLLKDIHVTTINTGKLFVSTDGTYNDLKFSTATLDIKLKMVNLIERNTTSVKCILHRIKYMYIDFLLNFVKKKIVN